MQYYVIWLYFDINIKYKHESKSNPVIVIEVSPEVSPPTLLSTIRKVLNNKTEGVDGVRKVCEKS